MTTTQDLLLKPMWSVTDVMAYVGCKKSKAYQIMARCKQRFNGSIPNEPSVVTRNSVLNYFKTSIEEEIYIKGIIENNEELHKRKLW